MTLTSPPPAAVLEALERADTANPACPLVPVEECHAVLAYLSTLPTRTEPDEAARRARTLVGFYRTSDVNDPRLYVEGVTATLAEFPPDLVRQVVHPVQGLPARLKWLPTIAEIRAELDALKAKRKLHEHRARWMLQERDKRKREEEERARIEADRVPPERIAAMLAHLRQVNPDAA